MIPLDTLLNTDEKSLLLKAREQYIRNPPKIIFYNMRNESTHVIPYKYDSTGNILLNVKDIEGAFLLPTHLETEWDTAEKVIRMVSTSVKEYIGYLYFVYSSLNVPRSDDRYNVLDIQKKWFKLGKGIDKDEE